MTYDVTSLSPDGTAFVKKLEDSFDAFLDSWRKEIIDGLQGARRESLDPE